MQPSRKRVREGEAAPPPPPHPPSSSTSSTAASARANRLRNITNRNQPLHLKPQPAQLQPSPSPSSLAPAMTSSRRNQHSSGGASAGSGSHRSTAAAAAAASQKASPQELLWRTKHGVLAQEVAQLTATVEGRAADLEGLLDAVEQMLGAHQDTATALQQTMQRDAAVHAARCAALAAREDASRLVKQRGLEETEALRTQVRQLHAARDDIQEATLLAQEAVAQRREALAAAQAAVAAEEAALRALQTEETHMQDATYGLSGEVKEMVAEMEALSRAQRETEVRSMQMEVARRELASRYEELKGAIRVFCRVKGQAPPPAQPSEGKGEEEEEQDGQSCASGESGGPLVPLYTYEDGATSPEPSREQSGVLPSSTTSSPPRSPAKQAGGGGGGGLEGGERRTITVHQVRANATSTGRNQHAERFSYDRVFSEGSSQEEVYEGVLPLVHSAIDGYHVCVFAYGQTGSGKTYTMEGSVGAGEEAHYGITPRAVATIFARQEALAREGWQYSLSCTFIEIYNEQIRDLLQSPTLYEPGGSNSAPHYHVIKHHGDKTSISHVKEKPLQSLEDFLSTYKLAVRHRRTAKTNLNDRSSRSHCVFTLTIDGVNTTIRQRSEGALCLVDLAGSERVHESGAQGQEFKEAVSINRSLLDLGKCIHAMRTATKNTVIPWRSSKLTYLLQNILGAKGGKMLMVVTVSDERRYLAESLNSLRFAQRVAETIVGSSVKRITNL